MQRLTGPEWEGVNRQYTVQDYLLAFSDAFDAAMDRLMLDNPYILAEDMCTLLEWQGGIRAFETALRFGKDYSVFDFGTGVELLEGKENGAVERRPLQAWGRLLELSSEARAAGTPFNRDLADREKQRVSSDLSCLCRLRALKPSIAGQRLLCERRIRQINSLLHDGRDHLPDGTYLHVKLGGSPHEDWHGRAVRRSCL